MAVLTVVIISFTAFSLADENMNLSHNNRISGSESLKVALQKNRTSIYDSLRLVEKGLTKSAFDYAIRNYSILKEKGMLDNDSIITIIDFDQPSYQKRMYIIDLKNYKILFNTWTAHGKNTGAAIAKKFSNTPESLESSLGVFVTEDTYFGKHGYSLRLVGLEKSNSSAYQRAIVVHGANYVSQETINDMGYIGRSFGCPAVPTELSKPIIDKIKGRSCFFIYNKTYHPSLKV
ncbi:MAG: murein L,D-transpeptidase catalytic domain family protein [Paludibacteraceae bacterium]